MSEYRWHLKAIAAEAALNAVMDAAVRHAEMQAKMIEEGRAGLQRIVDKGLDADLRDLSDCGYALGVRLKLDLVPKDKSKRRKRR